MPSTFENRQELFEAMASQVSPAEAEQALAVVSAQHQECITATEKARAAEAACHAACDETTSYVLFLRNLQSTTTAALDTFNRDARAEITANRHACDITGMASARRVKIDTMVFADQELDYALTFTQESNAILLLDAVENRLSAECAEVSKAALRSRLQTVAAMGPLMELEGADVGVIGRKTGELQALAFSLEKQRAVAYNAARDARAEFERRRNARVSKGIITSMNMPNAMGQ